MLIKLILVFSSKSHSYLYFKCHQAYTSSLNVCCNFLFLTLLQGINFCHANPKQQLTVSVDLI
eukprot:c36236_g1_i1 orf=1-186(-)